MTANVDTSKTEAFVDRLFRAALSTIDIYSVYLGDRLGLYKALAKAGPATAGELASRAGIHARYAREWLEQQAVSEVLDVDDPAKPEDQRCYSLPAAHAEALIDPESPFSIAPLARAFASIGAVLPKIMDAYRSGGGVPWSDYGADGIEAQGASTARGSSISSARSTSLQLRISMRASRPIRRRVLPTSPAASVGRPSPSRALTRR